MQPRSEQELAELWVSASVWEPHDRRAADVRPELERRLVAAGLDPAQLADIRASHAFTDAAGSIVTEIERSREQKEREADGQAVTSMATEALAERADAAYHRGQAEDATERAAASEAEGDQDTAADERGIADAERHQAAAAESAAETVAAGSTEDAEGAVNVRGNVYATGNDAARIAGEAYPEATGKALTRSRRHTPTSPRRPIERGREKQRGSGR